MKVNDTRMVSKYLSDDNNQEGSVLTLIVEACTSKPVLNYSY
jgi:hypothetical protein